MPGINLTRDEAKERARLIEVDSYQIELDLTGSDTTFSSTTTIRFACHHPGASTFADLVDATVQEIILNDVVIDPAQAYHDSRITLDALAADNVLRVIAQGTYSHTGEGLHRFVDPADGRIYLYSQFEVADARRVFATFEQPDLKGTYDFSVTAPAGWQVVSNSASPEPESVREGIAVWRFPTTETMSTYITALIAGEYHVARDTYSGRDAQVPLGIFCRQSMVEHLDADDIFEVTKQGFDFFESTFEMAYPFGKYDQLFVPEFNMGAMENAGAVTLRDEYLFRSRNTVAAYESRANTILHEMAHMWFGDLVTMRWWDDLWLNESFAEWAAHHSATVATKYTESWTTFANSRKTWAYRQDQLPSTHPIAADNYDLEAVEVNFDGITYAKGAAALRQLVAWVGEESFLAGLREYFHRHAYGNSELIDLLDDLELTSGRELGSWTKEWLQTSGVNTLSPNFSVGDDGTYTSFAVNQTAIPDYPTLRRHRIAIGLYDHAEGGIVRRSSTELDIGGPRTEVPALVGQPRADLVLLNDGDLTYAKIRVDEGSLAAVMNGIDTIVDSLPRALIWGAAWDMTRDAELPATDFVRLVLRGVGHETDLTAVGALLSDGLLAIDLYASPANRPGLRAEWEQGLQQLLEAADPGSDHQLAFARAIIRAAKDPDCLDEVAGWLDGTSSIEGLAVDTDLRWRITIALAAAGRIGDAEIDDELARDNTVTGQQEAAAARTAMPTGQAKERAWRLAVEADDTPNETQRSIAFAFQVPGQDELLSPYVDRYLDAASTIWETKGVQRATTALVGLFPSVLVNCEVTAKIDAWLKSTAANPAAKRYVSEGRSDLERALLAQARDAEAE
jgi:aminopeptidase N